MSDDKPPMPKQPTTTALEKPPAWAIAIAEAQAAGFASVNEKVDSLASSVEVLQHDAKDTRLRLGRMERELDSVKDRQNEGSIRVKAESAANLQQDAAIASIVVDVADLKTTQAEQLSILRTLESGAKALASHPQVKVAVGILWTALLGWLASKGWLHQ